MIVFLKATVRETDDKSMTTLSAAQPIGLLPPRGLGTLLRNSRLAAHLTPDDVSAALGHRLSSQEVAAHEQGTVVLADDDVRLLASLYGLRLDAIWPQRARLVIDRSEGVLSLGPHTERISENFNAEEVLIRYLALVYLLRGLKPGRFLVPRADDLIVLGDVLETTTNGVRRDLEGLMSGARTEIAGTSRLFGRRLAAPGLGLLVALTSASALLFMPSGPRADHGAAFGTPRVGTAVVFERPNEPEAPAPRVSATDNASSAATASSTDTPSPDDLTDQRLIVRL